MFNSASAWLKEAAEDSWKPRLLLESARELQFEHRASLPPVKGILRSLPQADG